MRRFIIEVLALTIAATLVWWATAEWLGETTIVGGKLLHRVIGYPAPSLAQGSHRFYWLAPLFPPLVGLILPSRWVSWPRRLIGLLIGLAAFWYMVSLQVAVTFTPYLTLSTERAYMMKIFISLNQVAVPVALWLIVTGGPKAEWLRAGRAAPDKGGAKDSAPDRQGLRLPLTLLATVAFCAVVTVPVKLAVDRTTPRLDAARQKTARAILADDYPTAIKAIDDMLAEQGGQNAALTILQREMKRRMLDTRWPR